MALISGKTKYKFSQIISGCKLSPVTVFLLLFLTCVLLKCKWQAIRAFKNDKKESLKWPYLPSPLSDSVLGLRVGAEVSSLSVVSLEKCKCPGNYESSTPYSYRGNTKTFKQ